MSAPTTSPISRTFTSARRLSRPSFSFQHQQSFSMPPASQVQERIEQLADMQVGFALADVVFPFHQLLLQERLDRQDAQLELILKLLQAPVQAPMVVETPPFSAIVPPDDVTIFD
jgi:hypothetical protein